MKGSTPWYLSISSSVRRLAALALAFGTSAALAQTGPDIGSAQVWGVNSAGNISRMVSKQGWQQVPGNLKQVSVGGDGAVWGVNSAGAIFRMVSNQWQQVPGVLTQVSVGNAQTVWGVNAAGNIWRLGTNQAWQQVPGSLKHVSVAADGTVWGVNSADEIYRMVSNQWQKVPGGLVQVSVGSAPAEAAPAPAPAPAPVSCTPAAPTGFVIGQVPEVCGVKFSWNAIPSIPECGAVSYLLYITENGGSPGVYNAGDRTATPFPTPKGVALTYSLAARRGSSSAGAATAPVAFSCSRDRVYWYPDPNKASHAGCIAGTVPCGRYLDMCIDARIENGGLRARCIDMGVNQFVDASLPLPCAGMVDRVLIDNRTNGKMYCLAQ